MDQIKLSLWQQRISEQKSSGLSVSVWCEQNQLTTHTYKYWLKRINDINKKPVEKQKQTLFAEVTPEVTLKTVSSKIQIKWHDLEIEISNSEEAVLSAELIHHLHKLC